MPTVSPDVSFLGSPVRALWVLITSLSESRDSLRVTGDPGLLQVALGLFFPSLQHTAFEPLLWAVSLPSPGGWLSTWSWVTRNQVGEPWSHEAEVGLTGDRWPKNQSRKSTGQIGRGISGDRSKNKNEGKGWSDSEVLCHVWSTVAQKKCCPFLDWGSAHLYWDHSKSCSFSSLQFSNLVGRIIGWAAD